MASKAQTIVKVTTEFRGFAAEPIIEFVQTSSVPGSPRWSAAMSLIGRKHAEKHAGPNPFASRVRSVTAALASKATIE
jgi:hypothetical protein